MPKSSKAKLAYQAKYQAEPAQLAKRIERNAARREAIRAGTAKVGDGKDVDHIKPLDVGGTNAKSNTRVVSEKVNRGWRKAKGGMYGK